MSGRPEQKPEEWRDIPDFPGYQISKEWRIINKETKRLKATIQDGTMTVKLSKDGQVYHRGVQGLLYSAFPELKDK